MTRVALYERVSTDEQAKEGASLAEQKERLELWAKLEGWEIARHYTDDGFSGATDDRPALQRLMGDARAHDFDLVAVTKLDRFMRNTRLLLNRIHDLKEYGISFASQAEAIDTRKPGIGNILLALLGAIAEWERDRISERLRDARRHRAEKHQWSSGRAPFGYRFNLDTKKLEIHEPEAAVVQVIFRTYIGQSLGIIRLAERLNQERKLTPRWGRRKHNNWTHSAVRHVLTHPAYKGGPNENWQYECPAIVDSSIWHLAQRRLATNRHFQPTKRTMLDFQGLLRCGLCRHTLRIGYDHNVTPKYECPGRLKRLHLDGSAKCTLPRLHVDTLEQLLIDQTYNTFSNPATLAQHFRSTLENFQEEKRQLEHRLNPLRSEVEQIERQMVIADTKLESGRLDPATYKATIAGLRAKKRDIERRQQELDPSLVRQWLNLESKIASYGEVLDKGIDQYAQELASTFCSDSSVQELFKRGVPKALTSWTHPRDLMLKYGMIAFVFPDKIELKGSVPLNTDGQSFVSPGYRLDRYQQSR